MRLGYIYTSSVFRVFTVCLDVCKLRYIEYIYIAYSVYISHTNAYMHVLYVLEYIFVIHIHLANCRVKRQRWSNATAAVHCTNTADCQQTLTKWQYSNTVVQSWIWKNFTQWKVHCTEQEHCKYCRSMTCRRRVPTPTQQREGPRAHLSSDYRRCAEKQHV